VFGTHRFYNSAKNVNWAKQDLGMLTYQWRGKKLTSAKTIKKKWQKLGEDQRDN
jgi:hypothetical protein